MISTGIVFAIALIVGTAAIFSLRKLMSAPSLGAAHLPAPLAAARYLASQERRTRSDEDGEGEDLRDQVDRLRAMVLQLRIDLAEARREARDSRRDSLTRDLELRTIIGREGWEAVVGDDYAEPEPVERPNGRATADLAA